MIFKYMGFALYSTTNFTKVFSLVIPQENPNYFDKAVPRWFLRPSDFIGEFIAHYYLYSSSDVYNGFDFRRKQFKEKVLEGNWSLKTLYLDLWKRRRRIRACSIFRMVHDI